MGYAMELLLEAGAFDVYFTPIQMKKNRPGVKLSVICAIDKQSALTQLLLQHTSTFGVRYKALDREILNREFISIETRYGLVRCKIGKLGQKNMKVVPEYEDCKRLAKEASIPIAEVFNEVLKTVKQ